MFNSEKMKDLVAQNFHDSNQFHSNENYKKFKCKLFIQDDSNSYGQYYGQKVTGLERRKKETKNKRRRRYEVDVDHCLIFSSSNTNDTVAFQQVQWNCIVVVAYSLYITNKNLSENEFSI